VPQFSGDLRIMAVAYKDKAFGSFDSHMKIADPIVISAALPRFFSPGDSVLMPVTLSNTTDKKAVAQIKLITQGAVESANGLAKTVTILPHREARVLFDVSAKPSIDKGKITVSVEALNEIFTNETEISVRPPASLQKIFKAGIVKANQTVRLPITSQFI